MDSDLTTAATAPPAADAGFELAFETLTLPAPARGEGSAAGCKLRMGMPRSVRDWPVRVGIGTGPALSLSYTQPIETND
jgi:hypothetical protein